MFRFNVHHKDNITNARAGEIATAHGVIQTPAFVPVGTQGALKSLTPDELVDLKVQLFFVNTYHMYLRPGIKVIQKLGGLHRFMGWDGPVITDSGGFQVFSLGREKFATRNDKNFLDPLLVSQPKNILRFDNTYTQSLGRVELGKRSSKILSSNAYSNLVKINDDGVEFTSHWDGTKHLFTPESSMEWQWRMGSDIHIAFDDCTPYPATFDQAKKSMERTHRWATRSLTASEKCKVKSAKLGNPYQALYGVVQGSTYEDLRIRSAKFISDLDFDGIAIGGVSVGESKKEMANVLSWVMPFLPDHKPRHLLGVGEIDDIFALVEQGIDTFDCVQPTRLARTGHVYIKEKGNWIVDITKKQYAQDAKPINDKCLCYTCQHFSRAYIHHLFRVRELLGYRLATIHNIHFINSLMNTIRKSIVDNTFLELKEKWLYNNFKL